MSLSLPRFQSSAMLVDENGYPSQAFHIWWNTFASNLEKAFNDLSNNVAAIAAAQAAADAAQTSATTAQTTATTAQTAAATVHVNDSISSSWTSPGSILSATDAGTNATITIANHTRKYNDGTSVSVTGSSITGLAYSTTYFLYYDDAAKAGGAVTYNASTDPNIALPGAASGRHYCGDIVTPASGGGGTSGGVSPPGSGGQLSGGDIP